MSTLSITSAEALGDLRAWADEPAHCNGNVQVGEWLHALQPESFPYATEVPPDLEVDVEELCGDWEEVLESGGDAMEFSFSSSAEGDESVAGERQRA